MGVPPAHSLTPPPLAATLTGTSLTLCSARGLLGSENAGALVAMSEGEPSTYCPGAGVGSRMPGSRGEVPMRATGAFTSRLSKERMSRGTTYVPGPGVSSARSCMRGAVPSRTVGERGRVSATSFARLYSPGPTGAQPEACFSNTAWRRLVHAMLQIKALLGRRGSPR